MKLKTLVFFWKYSNNKLKDNRTSCNCNEKRLVGEDENSSNEKEEIRSIGINFALTGRSRYYKTRIAERSKEADSKDGTYRDITDSIGKIADVSNPSQNKDGSITTNSPHDISKATEVYNHSKKELCEQHLELISSYCMPLVKVEFAGQSNSNKSDKTDEGIILNLGLYLSLLDRVIRKYKTVSEFTIEDEEYKLVLKLVASKRKLKEESTDACFDRLWKDSHVFEKIYHTRGEISEYLGTSEFWGTRQQLLCGKVIGDWVNCDRTNVDPIFGALLCPCGGRVGPGDSGWVHGLLYDDRGCMAYHAAVHDAFGYLITFHKRGPGYDYLKKSVLSKYNPFSGQYDGISFWKKVLEEQNGAAMASQCIENTFGILLSSYGNVDYTKIIC